MYERRGRMEAQERRDAQGCANVTSARSSHRNMLRVAKSLFTAETQSARRETIKNMMICYYPLRTLRLCDANIK